MPARYVPCTSWGVARGLIYVLALVAALGAPGLASAQQLPSGHWIASGFIGADFGGLADGSSFDLGGQLGFLYHGLAGIEFVGDFSPGFHLTNSVLADRPTVNAFMFNAIAAVPFGRDWHFQPYVAGGLGS